MNEGDSEQAGNAEDLFPIEEYPRRREYEETVVQTPDPWHKPRKQWIRENQWGKAAGRLLNSINFDGRPLYYFTLPGRYFLDVRHLHEICRKKNVMLRFLGFDSSRSSDARISIGMDEVWRLEHIDKLSVLSADRVEDIKSGSMAYKTLETFPNFDIVNLDLCKTVADGKPLTNASCLSAISTIVSLQSHRRTQPWYFYLTTRTDSTLVDSEVMTRLRQVLHENLNRSQEFRDLVVERDVFNVDAIGQTTFKPELGAEDLFENQFRGAFGIGFSKWLLKFALRDWKINLEFCAGYRVGVVGQPNMLSLVYKFEKRPIPLNDPLEIVPPVSPRAAVLPDEELETTCALKFVQRFQAMDDVDELFVNNEELRKAFAESNAKLMEWARFDYQTIYQWGLKSYWPH